MDFIESIIGDTALENNWTISVPKKTKHHVAVIGGGPAGLTCAAFLRRNGIKVTIYEHYIENVGDVRGYLRKFANNSNIIIS